MGGISDRPNPTPLASSTLGNTESDAPAQLFPLLVRVLFQNIVQLSPHPPVQAGEGLEFFPWSRDMAENFALLLSDLLLPVAWAAAMRSWSARRDSNRNMPVLNRNKFLNRQEYFVVIFLSCYLIVQENYLKESASTQDGQAMVLALLSIRRCCRNKTWLMICYNADTATCVCWCPVVLVGCLLNKCRDQLINFSVSGTALSVSWNPGKFLLPLKH